MKPATCKICRRKLTHPESIAKGVGPECAQKFAGMLCDAGLTLEALNIPEQFSNHPTVAKHLHTATQAMLAGNKADVERFKAAASLAAQRAEREALAETAWREEGQYVYGWPVQAAA